MRPRRQGRRGHRRRPAASARRWRAGSPPRARPAWCVADLDAAAARAVAAADRRGRATGVDCDVTDEARRSAGWSRAAEERYGPVDLFCSNAGITTGSGLEDDAPADWQRAWEVNVLAHVYAARAVLPAMLERGAGYLLQTCSAAGLLTAVGDAPYAVTKHAAVAFAEWLAITYGDRGIRVSALCPQGVRTPMLDRRARRRATSGARVTAASGAVLTPEQVADAVVDGLAAERFLILPHPEVAGYRRRKVRRPGRVAGRDARDRRRGSRPTQSPPPVPAQRSGVDGPQQTAPPGLGRAQAGGVGGRLGSRGPGVPAPSPPGANALRLTASARPSIGGSGLRTAEPPLRSASCAAAAWAATSVADRWLGAGRPASRSASTTSSHAPDTVASRRRRSPRRASTTATASARSTATSRAGDVRRDRPRRRAPVGRRHHGAATADGVGSSDGIGASDGGGLESSGSGAAAPPSARARCPGAASGRTPPSPPRRRAPPARRARRRR